MSEHFLPIDLETPDKPEIFRTASILKISQGDAFLCWFRVWSYWRTHSVDGVIEGIGKSDLDRISGVPGFADAALSVKWMIESADGFQQPRFDYHMHGCESLKSFKHRNRARKSRDNAALKEEFLKRLPSDIAEKVNSVLGSDSGAPPDHEPAHGNVRDERTNSAPKYKPEIEIETKKPVRSGPAGWEEFVLENGGEGGLLRRLWQMPALEPDTRFNAQLSGKFVCFHKKIWNDDWIKSWLKRTDAERKMAREQMFEWFRVQLAVELPIVPVGSPAVAAIVLALAESVANEKSTLTKPVGVFRTELGRLDFHRVTRDYLKVACDFVARKMNLDVAQFVKAAS